MAIYYATTKPISRSSGRSATASAAYRAGTEITDERTGLKHDYSKRDGVEMAYAFDKNMKKVDRDELWNKAELAENRKDGRTAREWVLAIPHELVPKDQDKRKDLKQNEGARVAVRFGKVLAERYNVGVDVAIHSPDKEGDNRNWHAHIMTTTRELSRTAEGIKLGEKTSIELSNAKRKELGLGSTSAEIKELRQEWETIVNTQLEKLGIEERIDHRSLKEQGIERQPTIKMGWQASAMERRGVTTDKGDLNREITADNEQLHDLKLEITILKEAKTEMANIKEQVQGMQDFKAEYEAYKQEQQQQKLELERQQKTHDKGQDRGFEI
ncbi:MobA/MobL family protein [Psychrobacter celer]|uniref:MobA/MobL family protein n=1 Tax=Psychrobacter celer TaxID=306572 RepID=UPI003FD0942B